MLSSAARSQTVDFSDAFSRTQTVTNGRTNEFRDMKTDTAGNTYVLANLIAAQTFNSQTHNAGRLLIKYNTAGQIQWVIADNGKSGVTLLLDSQGNPIVAGNQSVTTSQGWVESRLSITKYAATDGIIIWENIATSGAGDAIQDAALSPDGKIYIVFSKASFNPYINWGAVNNFGFISGATRNVILKADQNGTPEWAQYVKSGETWNIEGSISGICAGDDNEVYLVGEGVRLFSDAGTGGTFVSRVNNDGTFSWFKRVSTSTDHSATDVTYHEGHIYMCGDVANQAYTSLDFGDGVNATALDFQKGYIAKLAPNGTAKWLVNNTTGTKAGVGNGLRFFKLSTLPNGNIAALANLKSKDILFGGKTFNSDYLYNGWLPATGDNTMVFELDTNGLLISSFYTTDGLSKAQVLSCAPDNTMWIGGTYSSYNSAGKLFKIGNHTHAHTGGTNDYNFFIAKVKPEALALPVELVKFEAKTEHNWIKLNWGTASESNNKEFMISRSTNGSDFTKIGKVKGNGTSAQNHHYVFYDKEPLLGTNYYKLQQVDFDGETKYLGTKALTFSLDGVNFKAYPNPTTDKFNLFFDSGTYNKLMLYTATGDVLQKNDIEPSTSQLSLSLKNRTNGIYIILLQGPSGTKTFKVIKE
ncbi:hypothetical protein BCY91_12505 [Pelobium manganitolerans]|uniref:Secretion system C-terminal sorting domain-containing protein n=2 Tax=Pelobium manganitolerans TaxID=1842495 RepID=A0A419S1U1_9SPHI|nr:hypothetical protein BCY91_12505 [Pelobium manganitolerans]